MYVIIFLAIQIRAFQISGIFFLLEWITQFPPDFPRLAADLGCQAVCTGTSSAITAKQASP